jgi:hypothetical protein
MIVVIIALIVFTAVATLAVWWPRRHGNAGAAGTDPQGHRNLGSKGGPPVPKPGNNLGGGGGTGFGG